MGKWVHRLTDIDPEGLTGTCAECGEVGISRQGEKNGVTRWRCNRGPRKRNRDGSERRKPSPPHRLSDWCDDTMRAVCAICGPVDFIKKQSPWTEAGFVRQCAKGKSLQRRTLAGITPAERDAMLEAQGGKCAICGTSGTDVRWCADHCHTTGAVRGVLCHPCNSGLGMFRDNPVALAAAIDYLAAASLQAR